MFNTLKYLLDFSYFLFFDFSAIYSILVFLLFISICLWQPSPVLLPGKSHGQRSLVGCSPWVTKSRI